MATCGAIALAPIACQRVLPPHGEAIVVVDTDSGGPRAREPLARRSPYASDGTWFDSRDIARPDPHDWPASFSVQSGNDDAAAVVVVRLGAYAEGHVRDYLGERFEARGEYREPPVATSVEELCSSRRSSRSAAPSRSGAGSTVEAAARDFAGPGTLVGPD